MTGADALAQRLDATSTKTRKPDPRSLTRVITLVFAVDPARAAVANTRLVNCASATLNCVEPFIIARRLQVDEDAGSTDGMVMGGRSQVKSYLVTCRELKELGANAKPSRSLSSRLARRATSNPIAA